MNLPLITFANSIFASFTPTTSARLLQANGVKQIIETDEHSFENSQKIKLNSEIKFILELALQVVRLRGEKSIGTEHLLWGV